MGEAKGRRGEGGGDDGGGHLGDEGRAADDGVEAVVGVGHVVDGPLGAIGVDEGVLALDHVAVARLSGTLRVAGVRVRDAVRVAVLWVGVVGLGADSGDGGGGDDAPVAEAITETQTQWAADDPGVRGRHQESRHHQQLKKKQLNHL